MMRQDAIGEIAEEGFEVDAMNSSGKEFLAKAIGDYNAMFGCNYTVDIGSRLSLHQPRQAGQEPRGRPADRGGYVFDRL